MNLPEICLARRLVERRALVPPIDVQGILSEYADLEFVDFPIQIDGICLNLKTIGKRPKVLISNRGSKFRQRFTLAHELGHVLIPWHIGSIIDDIGSEDTAENDDFIIEAEANRFASELLMPSTWVRGEIAFYENPLEAFFSIADKAIVSPQAALIKLKDNLSPNYVIVRSSEGIVNWSARSAGTFAGILPRGFDLNLADPFSFARESWQKVRGSDSFKIWRFATPKETYTSESGRTCRDLLDEIAISMVLDDEERKKFKSSVSAVTGSVNGRVRSDRRLGTVVDAIFQRLHTHALNDMRYQTFVEHSLFSAYCRARAVGFLAE